MYQWQTIIEAQPSVKTAFAEHFQAVSETVRWELKCKALKKELAFLAKAKTEIEAQGLLTRKLEQAEQQKRQAKEAEDRAMQALEAERAKYQWLVDYSCGEEAKSHA